MKLKHLIDDGMSEGKAGITDIEISDLVYRSDQVAPGALFFCIKGLKADGHNFAADAAAKGAVALVCERGLDLDLPQLLVEDSRSAMARMADRFFGHPSGELDVVGITGTNGKTTTAYLVRQIFEGAGRQCGLLGTVEQVIAGRAGAVERTTPESVDLQRSLRQMVDGGDWACAMEVSSHALELNRCDSISFRVAAFTNLSQDHLDFHHTMENYSQAKRRLFFPESGAAPENCIVNVDDAIGRQLAIELKNEGRNCTTYAIENEADITASDVSFDASGSSFTVIEDGGRFGIETALPGHFNVYNALAAFAAARCLGVAGDVVADALKGASGAPGRFESIEEGQGFTVIVDYAHTPDSLDNVLTSARDVTPGRLIAVFGCGGDRDTSKRPLMGEIACRKSDHVIVTSDNPRNEGPEAIIDQVMAGCKKVDGFPASELERIVERRQAIARAFEIVERGDTVIVAGKGHEQGQEFEGGRKVEFDDRAVVRDCLKEA